jgi:hypothetical protein
MPTLVRYLTAGCHVWRLAFVEQKIDLPYSIDDSRCPGVDLPAGKRRRALAGELSGHCAANLRVLIVEMRFAKTINLLHDGIKLDLHIFGNFFSHSAYPFKYKLNWDPERERA